MGRNGRNGRDGCEGRPLRDGDHRLGGALLSPQDEYDETAVSVCVWAAERQTPPPITATTRFTGRRSTLWAPPSTGPSGLEATKEPGSRGAPLAVACRSPAPAGPPSAPYAAHHDHHHHGKRQPVGHAASRPARYMDINTFLADVCSYLLSAVSINWNQTHTHRERGKPCGEFFVERLAVFVVSS